jgi:hypothetical protein
MRDNYEWNPKKTINTLNKMVGEGRGSWDMTDDELLSELLARENEKDKDNKDDQPIDATEDLAQQAEAAPTLVEQVAAELDIDPGTVVDMLAELEEAGFELGDTVIEIVAQIEAHDGETTLDKYFPRDADGNPIMFDDDSDTTMADATKRAIDR